MDRIKTLTLFAATALLAASCVKEEPTCDACGDNSRGTGINLTFTTGIETRSELTSSEIDYKDVDDVYLYGFKGAGGDATCFLVKDLDWVNEDKDSNQEEPNPQHFWISTDLPEGDLTFLAVGVDDNAGGVYGFPGSITVGSTLSNCLAKLADGKGKEAMRTAQFFSGYTTTNAGGESVIDVEITLTRRVTGVLTYLSNIPYTVNFSDANSGKAQVTDVRLVLASPQNTQMKLWPAATDNAPVYGETPLPADEENKVLFSVNLAGAGYQSDAKERYYTKDALTGEVTTLPNTLLMGAYLLPMNITSGNTLQLQLLGTYADNDGGEHTNEVVKTYTINNSQGEPTFSLEENYLYSIGKKLSDGSTNGDKPADLSGNILQVNIVKWCKVDMPNSFPEVNGPATFDKWYDEEKYIFDAPGSINTVTIEAANPNPEHWRIEIEYEEGDGFDETAQHTDWIHIRYAGETDAAWTTEITNTTGDERDIEFILNDFAEPREYNDHNDDNYIDNPATLEKIRNDYRTAYLLLYTDGVENPHRLKIRQYNTITVFSSSTNKDDGRRGVARLDYGCSFNLMSGESNHPNTDNIDKIQWGYWSSYPLGVTGDAGEMDWNDGEKIAQSAYDKDENDNWESFNGSAIQKLWTPVINIPDGSQLHWYLPAHQEMWAIANHMNKFRDLGEDCQEVFNMYWNDKYWYAKCPSAGEVYNGGRGDAFYVIIGDDSKMKTENKRNFNRARAIRKFE